VSTLLGRRQFWIILALGFAVRVIYLAWSRELPFFHFPFTDALYHHRWAQAIAGGVLWDGRPFFRAPFYPYVLGSLYTVFGSSVWVGKIFGHVLGLVTGGLVMALADRLFHRRAALIAGWLWLGSGLVMFFESELLLDSLFTFLFVWWLFLLLTGVPATRRLAAAGFVFGLACITRPTMLALAPVFFIYAWHMLSGLRPARRTRLAVLLGAAAVPVLVIAGLNSYALGRPAGIATQGGINFYVGNNPAASGYSAVLPPPWGYAWNYRDLARHAEVERGRPLDDAEVSDYYFARGWHFIRTEPGQFASLLLRKALLTVNSVSISDNLNIPWLVRKIPLLQWLPVRVAFLVPPAVLGWLLPRPRPREFLMLWAVIAVYTAALTGFFVIERFRLPLVPLWILFAAFGVGAFLDRRARLWAAALLLAGGIVVLPNWYGIDTRNQAQAYFNLGNVALKQGDNRRAEALLDTALSWQPELQQLRLNRGLARLRQGAFDSARDDFEAEAARFPFDARAFTNLAALHLLDGDSSAALAAIDSGLARDSGSALLYLQRLKLAVAREDTLVLGSTLDLALRHSGDLPVWSYWKGERARLAGRNDEARRAYREFRNTPPGWPTLDVIEPSTAGPALPEVDYQIGLTWLAQGALDSAALSFGRAATADSSFVEAWSNWGTAALAAGDPATAVARYRAALRFAPDSPLLWTNVAYGELSMGRPDSARTALVRALAADPGFGPARELVAGLEALP
jgi:tetratricopeptide (TPR) repeat protein